MKIQSRKIVSVLLILSIVLCSATFSMPSKAAVVTTVYDFNGTDFSTSLQTTNVGPDITVVSDTSVIPTGFTGSVMSATHSTYVSAGVDFSMLVDVSKITSIKVRMYVPSYSLNGSPQLRILSSNESTSVGPWSGAAFIDGWGGAFDQWVEIDITTPVKNVVAKDENNLLDRFVIGYRVYGTNATVYYDSLIIESSDDFFVQPPADDRSVFDFNDIDFATTLQGSGDVETSEATGKLTDTSSVPSGFAGSVHAGGGQKYAAVAVDFPQPLDTSVITKVTVRMYVPSYSLNGIPKLRILSTDEKNGATSLEYVFETDGGAFDSWCEFDITKAVKSVVTKDGSGYLDRFVIAYRIYGNEIPTVYYDNVSITHKGELFVESQNPGETTGDVYDFNGTDFKVLKQTNTYLSSEEYFASALSNTSTVPSGFANGVYAASNHVYSAAWIDFNGKIDLSKVTSIRIRMYISSYALESGKTPAFRIFGTGDTYIQQSHDGTYDKWFELELLDLLKDANVKKNSDGTIRKFLVALRAYGTSVPKVYYDSIIIEGTDYYTEINTDNYVKVSGLSLLENISGRSKDLDRWDSYITTGSYDANCTLPGTPWVTKFTGVTVVINNVEHTLEFWRADDSYGLFLDIWQNVIPLNTAYAKITIKAGEYAASDDANGIIIQKDFSYYLYNGDLWNTAPPADFAVDVSFEKLSTATRVNGSNWDVYPTPYNASQTPGIPWKSSWLNVVYEIDGVSYSGTMERANNNEGLYIRVPSTQLSPAADGVTFTIKAGIYASKTDADPSIRITEDFTFYVINGSPTTDFDFDDPAFSAPAYCDVDNDPYVVTGSDSVTINGKIYHPGETFNTIGTHTLTYTMWGREYTRTLVLYRIGETRDDAIITPHDLIRMKRTIAEMTELTESETLGADMDANGSIDAEDTLLLRSLLVMDNGLLLLYPKTGITAMLPSEQVATLETNYDLTASKSADLKNGTELFHRSPLNIKWISKENVDEYTVYVADNMQFANAFIHRVTKPEIALYNLLPDTTYYWKVVAGNAETDIRTFRTADTVRTFTIEGVDNARDIGGYTTIFGTKIKYNMVYRTATLDEITDAGRYQMKSVLGVKTDLDVRTPGEGTAGTRSPIGDDINYINYNGPYYWNSTTGLLAASYQDALRGEIRAFADADNYPIVVHCSVGRDRTGTLLFLIEGLCGMTKSDLFFEYEMSFLARIGGGASANVPNMMRNVETMYNGIQAYAPDGTFAEACEAFILSLGITQAEIDSIRNLMTE